MKKNKYSLVEIIWVDSSFNSGWHSQTSYSTPSECRTVGYLTHKKNGCVNVSMNLSPESRGETMAIPSQCVKSIRKIKL